MTRYQCAAHIDERGRAHGGRAGDQTGREVNVSAYSNHGAGYDYALRYEGPDWKRVRNRSIKAAVKIAARDSNGPGYDQYQRDTLYGKMKGFKWLYRKIGSLKACETDCSSFMAVVSNIARCPLGKLKGTKYGKAVPSDCYTGNEGEYFTARGYRRVRKGVDFDSGAGLKPGDVLVKESSHTAMYIGTRETGSLY